MRYDVDLYEKTYERLVSIGLPVYSVVPDSPPSDYIFFYYSDFADMALKHKERHSGTLYVGLEQSTVYGGSIRKFKSYIEAIKGVLTPYEGASLASYQSALRLTTTSGAIATASGNRTVREVLAYSFTLCGDYNEEVEQGIADAPDMEGYLREVGAWIAEIDGGRYDTVFPVYKKTIVDPGALVSEVEGSYEFVREKDLWTNELDGGGEFQPTDEKVYDDADPAGYVPNPLEAETGEKLLREEDRWINKADGGEF